MTVDTLAAALAYAARGWAVLPCKPREKVPASAHGLNDASTERAALTTWFGGESRYNIAIRTGNGLLVLDADGEAGEASLAALERKHGALPETVVSLTGRGRHFLYAVTDGAPVPNSAGKLGPHLDTRGDGGYILVEPSIHPSGRMYAWDVDHHPDEWPLAEAPGWLLALLREREAPPAEPSGNTVREGGRETHLASLAGTMRRKSADASVILAALRAENAKRCAPPLPDHDLQRIAKSIARYGVAEAVPNDDLDVLAITPEPSWPRPLGDAAFHGLAGEIVRTIEPQTEADPAALLVQFLAAFGATLGREPHVEVAADRHAGNLFVALVGETAKGRKGVSLGYPRRIVEGADPSMRERIQSGLSSGEGLIHAVRDRVERDQAVKKNGKTVERERVVVDEGVKDKRLLVVESELAAPFRVIRRDGNTLSPLLRLAWDGGDLRTLTRNNPLVATGPHVALIGHITRQELLNVLDGTEAANGMLNRFLWVSVRRARMLPEGGHIDAVVLDGFARRAADALAFARHVAVVRRTDDARELWAEVYPSLSEDVPGLLGAATARAEAQVLRLSMLYALLDTSANVEPGHLRAALEVWRYCAASARFIFGDRFGDPALDTLWDALRNRPEGMTRTDIRDLFGRHRSGESIEGALARLSRMGRVRRESVSTGGRAAERWFAHVV